MYIGFEGKKNKEKNKEKKKEGKNKADKADEFFAKSKAAEEREEAIEREVSFSQEEEITIENALHQWQAVEYEVYRADPKWYLVMILLLLGIVAYAVYTNSPLMAITFILIGVLGYIFFHREPKTLTFSITKKGVWAGKELAEFEKIDSFWIFYEPEDIKVVSFRMKGRLIPYIRIPVGGEEPVKLREILIKHIPERKQKMGFVDKFEQILGI
ncbi:MAG: hypothetical protein NTZ97_00410 [Candidatus Moranbacteria bacterium]|nr:hypothetical protein [Candidatus Moranbacteria bacterium]